MPEDASLPQTDPTGSTAPGPETTSAVLRAVRRVLAPLVRLLISHQITFPVLANLLKSIYVEEAQRRFALPDRPQTISRLTLLTGVHRKDVKRLQQEAPEQTAAPVNVSIGAQLVLRWTAEPAYHDAGGHPAPLPRRARSAAGPSFEDLVESVTQDIRPRAVLDEWLRLGVVRVDANGDVHLVEDAFVPAHGFEEKAYFLGRNLRDHAAAAVHNVLDGRPPMLERSVYYARLRPESVDELQTLATRLGTEALQQLAERGAALQRADQGAEDAALRISFGLYFFRAQLTDADPSDTEGDDRGDGDAD